MGSPLFLCNYCSCCKNENQSCNGFSELCRKKRALLCGFLGFLITFPVSVATIAIIFNFLAEKIFTPIYGGYKREREKAKKVAIIATPPRFGTIRQKKARYKAIFRAFW